MAPRKKKLPDLSQQTKDKAKEACHSLGRDFQEVAIGFLTTAAGIAANDVVLTGFGALLFLALFLKEFTKRKSGIPSWMEIVPYILFAAGYIGGGYNFIQSYFLPEMQMKAFGGLAILAFAHIIKGYYERMERRAKG